jgi:hypothetical protein
MNERPRCPKCGDYRHVEPFVNHKREMWTLRGGQSWTCGTCRLTFAGTISEWEYYSEVREAATVNPDPVPLIPDDLAPGWEGVRQILALHQARPLYRRCMDCGSNLQQGPGCDRCEGGRVRMRDVPGGLLRGGFHK